MTIYAHRRTYEDTFGKEVPAMGPWKNIKPKIYGPGAGKIKAGIYAAYTISKFVSQRPWALGTLTGTAIGTGLALNGETNVTPDSYNQALSSNSYNVNRFRRNQYRNTSSCYCKHRSANRNKSCYGRRRYKSRLY